MKRIVLMLVMELMLTYPAEEISLQTIVEHPVSIQENIALNRDEEEEPVLPQLISPPPVEVQERREESNIARHEVRKTVQIFEATAYCSCVKCCGKSDGITKSGVKVHKGTLAVDPRVIPLGTKVYIEGMGWFIAEDTGNFSGKRVDIYMETHEKALQFGRKKVNVVF